MDATLPPPARTFSRREILQDLFRTGLVVGLSGLSASRTLPGGMLREPFPAALPRTISADDEAFLDEIERAHSLFFWENADPLTGLVRDRSLATSLDSREIASIAATGFGLTGLCIASQRGYLEMAQARDRALVTLRFLAQKMETQHGFYYHFVNFRTGERAWKCELSSIDTSLLLCGVLTCRAFFRDDEIQKLAVQIYERVDWPWFLNGGKALSMGWHPESGFLSARWDSYSELMMIYLLGLGSPTHPLPPETWDAWKRPQFNYYHLHYIGSLAPIFVHQYSQAWFDFRGKQDRYADYFSNSITATQAHRLFCLNLSHRFPDYSPDLWGISSSDSAKGYVAWGGPPPTGPIDGTVIPCAAAGSLPFLTDESLRVLRNIRENYGKRAWKRYGFVDAFNPLTNWYDPDVIGIDVGISLLMAENLRSGFVWETFMKNEEARRGMERAGFKPNAVSRSHASTQAPRNGDVAPALTFRPGRALESANFDQCERFRGELQIDASFMNR
jgi:hypothetical protein